MIVVIVISVNSTGIFGWESVVFHTKIPMLGKSWGHARSRCGGLNARLFKLLHGGPNSFWHPKNDAKTTLVPNGPI